MNHEQHNPPPGRPSIVAGPRDLPRARDTLVDFFGTHPYAAKLRELDMEQGRIATEAPTTSLRRTRWAAQEADLFYVTADMCHLVAAAAATLPPFTLQPADLPSPHGLAWFADPIVDHDDDGWTLRAVGLLWAGAPGSVTLTTIISRDSIPADLLQAAAAQRHVAALPPIVPFGSWQSQVLDTGAPVVIGTDVDLPPAGRNLLASAKTLWLLMRQPLAENMAAAPDRTERRRAERAGQPPAAVRVITLRRPAHTAEPASGGTAAVEWRHRWVVRGYWRTRHRGEELIRPIWVRPHVKGPEGLPFIGGDKVHLVRGEPVTPGRWQTRNTSPTGK